MPNVKCPVCQLELEGEFELTEEVQCPSCLATFVPSRVLKQPIAECAVVRSVTCPYCRTTLKGAFNSDEMLRCPSCEGEFKPPRKNAAAQLQQPSLKNCQHALREAGLMVLAILAILGECVFFGIIFMLVKAGTGLRTAPALSGIMLFAMAGWTWKSITGKCKQPTTIKNEPRPQSVGIGCLLTALSFSFEWLVMFICIVTSEESYGFVEFSKEVVLTPSIPWFAAKTMVAVVVALMLWRMSARSINARIAFNTCFGCLVPLAIVTYLVLLKSGKIVVFLYLLKWLLVGVSLILVNSAEASRWFGKTKRIATDHY